MNSATGMPEAILFDVDGTLLHSQEAYFEIFATALDRLGFGPPPRWLTAAVMNHGTSPFDIVFPADLPDRQQVIQRYYTTAAEIWPVVFARVLPLPDVPAVLAALAAAGIPLALVTASRARVIGPLRRLGLDRYFATAISREDVDRPKPAPDAVLMALERLGVAPARALLVGDTPMDIRCGREAGIRTIGVTTGTADAALLGEYEPDLVLPDLTALLPILGLSAPGPSLHGHVARGLGEAADFMAIPWVQAALTVLLGVPPHPGTVNLVPASAADQAAWAALTAGPFLPLPAQAPGFCDARCYPVQIDGRVPGLALVPAVPDYPADKIEVVAPIHLGEALGLTAGSAVTLVATDAARQGGTGR